VSNRLVSCYPEGRPILRRTNLSSSNCLERDELTWYFRVLFVIAVELFLAARFIFIIQYIYRL